MKLNRLLSGFIVVILASSAQTAELTKGPYLESPATTAMTVAWEADQPGAAAVLYGPTRDLGRRVEAAGNQALRKVRIEGLVAGQEYYYKVSDGGAESAIFTFRTLPEKGGFTFAAYGDTRTNAEDHARVASDIRQKNPLFVLHTGDLVADGRKIEQWGPQFFAPAAGLLATAPVLTVAGNHERESPNYYRFFGAPSGKPWYSFDCVNAHFTMLDSCISLEPGSDEYKWLESDLASTDKRWRIAAFHYPLYSSSEHGSDHRLRRVLEPLFQKYNVDLVFVGHDHVYERTYPIVSAFASVHPITHIIAGGGGAPRYHVSGDFFTAKCTSSLNFCMVKIEGDALSFEAYNGAGEMIDNFEIRKSGDSYEKGYLDKTTPVELVDLDENVKEALESRKLRDLGDGDRAAEYTFTAPAWGEMTIDVRWQPEGKAQGPGGSAHLVIPAGKSETASVRIGSGPSGAVPTVTAAVKTSLGDFKLTIESSEPGKQQ